VGVAAWADQQKVEQIVLNLLSNAVKFTPRDGNVTVSCGLSGDQGTITVRDTGPGVPAEKTEVIFEPFVQLGRSLTSHQEGTGLGLAISRDLAHAMNGEITLESTVGKGSTFTLSLPRAPRMNPADVAAATAAALADSPEAETDLSDRALQETAHP